MTLGCYVGAACASIGGLVLLGHAATKWYSPDAWWRAWSRFETVVGLLLVIGATATVW